jgi:protein phosphatase
LKQSSEEATVEWPDGSLILLVGPSGAGKSSWAADRFGEHEVLESDAFRAMVSNDPGDQGANADAFRLLHSVVRARLRRRLSCVVDATNLTPGARRALLVLGDRSERPVFAVVFDISLERCLAQNAARSSRRVPAEVIVLHVEQLQAAKAAMPGEGFTGIVVLTDDDIAPA